MWSQCFHQTFSKPLDILFILEQQAILFHKALTILLTVCVYRSCSWWMCLGICLCGFFSPSKQVPRLKGLNCIIISLCPLDMIQLRSSMRSLGMSRLQSLGYLLRLLAELSIIFEVQPLNHWKWGKLHKLKQPLLTWSQFEVAALRGSFRPLILSSPQPRNKSNNV